MKDKILGIIGGKGKMAKWFIDRFGGDFQDCLIADKDDSLSIEDLISGSDVILLSVPISKTISVLKTFIHLLREDQLLMDLTSIKEDICKEMAKSKSAVIGLHPLFGPNAEGAQTVVMCKVSGSGWAGKIQRLLEEKKYKVVEMKPHLHDEIMAYVQGLNHFLHLNFGKTLLPHDLKVIKSVQTPHFKTTMESLEKILQRDPKLYRDIVFENPYFLKVIEEYIQNAKALKMIIKTRDSIAFEELFKSLKEGL